MDLIENIELVRKVERIILNRTMQEFQLVSKINGICGTKLRTHLPVIIAELKKNHSDRFCFKKKMTSKLTEYVKCIAVEETRKILSKPVSDVALLYFKDKPGVFTNNLLSPIKKSAQKNTSRASKNTAKPTVTYSPGFKESLLNNNTNQSLLINRQTSPKNSFLNHPKIYSSIQRTKKNTTPQKSSPEKNKLIALPNIATSRNTHDLSHLFENYDSQSEERNQFLKLDHKTLANEAIILKNELKSNTELITQYQSLISSLQETVKILQKELQSNQN